MFEEGQKVIYTQRSTGNKYLAQIHTIKPYNRVSLRILSGDKAGRIIKDITDDKLSSDVTKMDLLLYV